MVEPLSIVASVGSILGVCIKVGVELKSFRNGIKTVDERLDGLVQDVTSLEQVLVAMKETVDKASGHETVQATGHIGNHWRNLEQALEDGEKALTDLRKVLEGVSKDVKFLDGARKEMRLKSAMEQITAFRQRAQSVRDVLQLSLQSILL
jgi:hypothetical protein